MNYKKYMIGLDIGNKSIGWAVINPNSFEIVKCNNKKLWGFHLLEKETENNRILKENEKTNNKRKERLKFLQFYFEEKISQIDHNFFVKLKNANEINEIDLTKEERLILKTYYRKYPTIYHLRHKIINSNNKEDIRLIYLAIHHIIKFPGNFLYDNPFKINALNIKEEFKKIFENILVISSNIEIDEDIIHSLNYALLEQIVMNDSNKSIKIRLKEQLNPFMNNKIAIELGNLLSGSNFDIGRLFQIQLKPAIKVNFSDNSYNEKYNEIKNLIGNKIEVLNLLKEVYDIILLKRLFKEDESVNISSLLVKKYQIHRSDLGYLKSLFENNQSLYTKMFRNKEDSSLYEKFIANQISYNHFKEELIVLINQLLEQMKNEHMTNEYKKIILPRLKNGQFLPRINDIEKEKYPYQLHKEELIQIIENQGKYYPYLLEKENNNYKIVNLLEFNLQEQLQNQFIRNIVDSMNNKEVIEQSLKILNQIVKNMKSNPDMIFINISNENCQIKQSIFNKNKLVKIYEKYKNSIDNYNRLNEEISNYKNINDEKLLLYFMQEGKSLYSGKFLNIEELENYEIDFIIPKTLIKDDSIDNKALVYKEEQIEKRHNLVLSSKFQHIDNKMWWQKLNKIGLMSSKKLHNIMKEEYPNEIINWLINNQTTETRQIYKYVSNMLNNLCEGTKVVYLKNDFINNYYKSFKHLNFYNTNRAHDAYLVACLGYYKEKCISKISYNEFKELNKKWLINGDYNKMQYGYVINSLNESSYNSTEKTSFDLVHFNQVIDNNLIANYEISKT